MLLPRHVPQGKCPASAGAQPADTAARAGMRVGGAVLGRAAPPVLSRRPARASRTPPRSQGFAGPEARLTCPHGNPAFEADPRGLCESTAQGGGRDAAGDRAPGAGQLTGERAEPAALQPGARAGGAEPRQPGWGGSRGAGPEPGAGPGRRRTRGAGQWGARPRPSLLRAFAAPAASREPRGVSAQ